MKTAFQSMKLAIAGYLVPFFFIYKPGLALFGSPLDIAISVLEGVIATILIAMAVEDISYVPWLRSKGLPFSLAGSPSLHPGGEQPSRLY